MKRAIGFLAVLLIAVGALVGATGGAVAADVSILNETVGVDNDTRSAYAEISVNDSANASGNFTVTYEGIDSDGNVTGELDSRNVTVDSGNTTLEEFSDVNASAYDSIRVKVMLDNTTVDKSNVTATAGTIQKVAGSGGASGGSGFSLDSLGPGGFLLLALVGAVILFGRGDD